MTFNVLGAFLGLMLLACGASAERQVNIQNNQLFVDGATQPQLFGAELQYFRLRGGYERNVPRERVLQLWEKAITHLANAKMNAVSFYIPWDFHEYAEGQFDFTGTADEDGDGRPDYPSRDILTFIQMLKAHGITRIMVRPGPYINAEWGFLGFGAIPEWFHNKYPDSHMLTSYGWRTRLYDYHNPDLLRHTRLWFEAVYTNVMKNEMGPGKPIVFVQLDNETNFMWGSIYSNDYGPRAVQRYQDFLKVRYQNSLHQVNAQHGRSWGAWTDVQPPTQAGANIAEDQDWYRFQDQSIHSYLIHVRKIWEDLGVREPQILFTLAESYNASDRGLLPHYIYRNDPGRTGMMTVNLYPKTYETDDQALMNTPFKADLDVKSADEASDLYLRSRQEWVLGPEIQGGWWRSTPVSAASRQQTYLTVLGHGMKALFVYYFNEGQNWGAEWGYDRVKPRFDQLRKDWKMENIPLHQLSNEFWGELQAQVDREVIMAFNVRHLMETYSEVDKTLFFDAPIDAEAQPRQHYFHLQTIGEKVIAPYQDFLGRAVAVHDDVALVKDNENHVPSLTPEIDAIKSSSDWNGALLGALLNSSLNPRILFGDVSPEPDFSAYKLLVHLDTNGNSARTRQLLQQAYKNGQTLVNILGDQIAHDIGWTIPSAVVSAAQAVLTFHTDKNGHLHSRPVAGGQTLNFTTAGPLFVYDLKNAPACEPLVYWQDKVVGYRCQKKDHMPFVQIGSVFFADYNSSDYARMSEAQNRRTLMTGLFKQSSAALPRLQLSAHAERTVAFARKDPQQRLLWITVKTGTQKAQSMHLRVHGDLLNELQGSAGPKTVYRVLDLLGGTAPQTLNQQELIHKGLHVSLVSEGSTVYVIERL